MKSEPGNIGLSQPDHRQETQASGIRDNFSRGTVGAFLNDRILANSALSVVSAYFTIYAYEALANRLDSIQGLRFLFGEPRFIASLDPEKTDKKSFKIEDEGLELANRLQQKEVARRCADWIRDKVEIRSIRQANLLHGKLYHIDDGRREHAILGSSNFTRRGLGLAATPNIELNLIVDSDRDRTDLKVWFESIWSDEKLVEDVKEEVLRYLSRLYINHPPEFIYYKTRTLPVRTGGRCRTVRSDGDHRHGHLESAIRLPEGRRQGCHPQDQHP